MALGENQILLLCQRNITINWFLMTDCNTHDSGLSSVHIWEAFSYSRWKLTQSPTTGQCAEWETLEPSVLHGCLHQTPHLGVQGVMWKRKREKCKTQRWWMTSRTQCPPDTAGVTHRKTHRDHGSTNKACTGSSQTGSQYWEGAVDTGPHPHQDAICNWHTLVKENQFSPVDTNHT